MTTATISNTINGVNVEALSQTIDAVKATPEIAKFKFRLNNRWIGGGLSRSMMGGFYGAGAEQPRDKGFMLDADEPPVLLGTDQGPNPAEYLLTALAACVTTAMVYHAAERGIKIQEIESDVEGDLDLRGVLGVDGGPRNGYENIRMNFRIKADVSDDEIQEVCNLGPTYSPIFDTVTRGVPVNVTARRM